MRARGLESLAYTAHIQPIGIAVYTRMSTHAFTHAWPSVPDSILTAIGDPDFFLPRATNFLLYLLPPHPERTPSVYTVLTHSERSFDFEVTLPPLGALGPPRGALGLVAGGRVPQISEDGSKDLDCVFLRCSEWRPSPSSASASLSDARNIYLFQIVIASLTRRLERCTRICP